MHWKPQKVADQLEFVTNGVTQEVEVEAWGLNATRLHGVRVEKDMHLTAERPYIVFDSLSVENRSYSHNRFSRTGALPRQGSSCGARHSERCRKRK